LQQFPKHPWVVSSQESYLSSPHPKLHRYCTVQWATLSSKGPTHAMSENPTINNQQKSEARCTMDGIKITGPTWKTLPNRVHPKERARGRCSVGLCLVDVSHTNNKAQCFKTWEKRFGALTTRFLSLAVGTSSLSALLNSCPPFAPPFSKKRGPALSRPFLRALQVLVAVSSPSRKLEMVGDWGSPSTSGFRITFWFWHRG